MIANLLNLLFVVAAMAVTLTLADCWVRGRNAWRIARRELAQLDMAIAADLVVEQHLLGNVMPRRFPARRNSSGYGINRARRLPRPVHAPIHAEAA